MEIFIPADHKAILSFYPALLDLFNFLPSDMFLCVSKNIASGKPLIVEVFS